MHFAIFQRHDFLFSNLIFLGHRRVSEMYFLSQIVVRGH